jgi:uncharacterized protein YcfL
MTIMEQENMYEEWYNEVIGFNYGESIISSQSSLISNMIDKDYVDKQIESIAPITSNDTDITFSINENKKLVIKEDGIYWYDESGEKRKIKDSKDLSIGLEAVVRSIIGENLDVLVKRLKREAFDEMIADIGIQGERLLKLEKLFNEKND